MKKLIEHIVSGILGSNDYAIEKKIEDGRELYDIKVEKDMIGKIIGRGGNVIKSIRNVVKIKAILEKKSIFINVSEK